MKDFSNYHNLNDDEKLTHDGLVILEKSLTGFSGYDTLINDTVSSRVLIYQKWDANSETKKIIGRIEDIERGNLLLINGLTWLITTFPEDNKIYRKAEMKLCNSKFPIENEITKVQIGTNPMTGQPIFEEIIEPIYVPCVVKHNTGRPSNTHQFMVPEGGLEITLQYQLSGNTVLDFEFEMYGQNYKIVDVDYTKVINNKGIMTIIAEKVV